MHVHKSECTLSRVTRQLSFFLVLLRPWLLHPRPSSPAPLSPLTHSCALLQRGQLAHTEVALLAGVLRRGYDGAGVPAGKAGGHPAYTHAFPHGGGEVRSHALLQGAAWVHEAVLELCLRCRCLCLPLARQCLLDSGTLKFFTAGWSVGITHRDCSKFHRAVGAGLPWTKRYTFAICISVTSLAYLRSLLLCDPSRGGHVFTLSCHRTFCASGILAPLHPYSSAHHCFNY